MNKIKQTVSNLYGSFSELNTTNKVFILGSVSLVAASIASYVIYKKYQAPTTIKNPLHPAFKDKTKHIVIIGAGPAGIHMASLLAEAGFINITILEKTGRIGGKSYTWTDKDGVPHEMGTCYTHPEYDEIFDLLNKYDPKNKLEPFSDRTIITKDLNEMGFRFGDADQPVQGKSMTGWMMREIEKFTLPEELHWVPDVISGSISFVDAVGRYASLHRKIFGNFQGRAYGFPTKPNNMADINMTFGKWLNEHKLYALIPTILYAQSIQGYGLIRDLPALYGLWWMRPEMLMGVITNNLTQEPMVNMVRNGFQSLWEHIADFYQLNIKTNCNILSVNRHLDDTTTTTSTGNGITIHYNRFTGKNDSLTELEMDDIKVGTNQEVIDCDLLFIASNVKNALQFLDATAEEKNLFSQLKSYTFVTSIYERKFRDSTAIELFPNVLNIGEGGVCAKRNSARIVRKEMQKQLQEQNVDRVVSYQFINSSIGHDPMTVKGLKQRLLNELQSDGVHEDNILQFKTWDYFPKFPQEAINKGHPWYVKEQLQGKYNNTFYIGSSVSFESVIDVVEYNYAFRDQFGF